MSKIHIFSYRRVASRQVVLLENTQHLTYLQESYLTNRIGESPVRLMLEECINPFGIGALLRRNSPLKDHVDMVCSCVLFVASSIS